MNMQNKPVCARISGLGSGFLLSSTPIEKMLKLYHAPERRPSSSMKFLLVSISQLVTF